MCGSALWPTARAIDPSFFAGLSEEEARISDSLPYCLQRGFIVTQTIMEENVLPAQLAAVHLGATERMHHLARRPL
jgi:hypothetical protein